MWLSNILIKFILITVSGLLFANNCSANDQDVAAKGYIITAEEDAVSELRAQYLYDHLKKRTQEKSIVLLQLGASYKIKTPKGFKNIHLEIAEDLKDDYCIQHTYDKLHIRVCSDRLSIWMIYQLIETIATKDSRFNADDLPPAFIKFNNGCKNFDFNYRDPFFSSNLQPEYAPIIGTHSVDLDWGLWGHNLSKIITSTDNSIYATINDIQNKEQFCFSSDALFDNIVSYIIDNYGDGKKLRSYFMIMPQDNDLVCMCPLCRQAGNSNTVATPAVVNLLNKLAEKFPYHYFFTTAYRTTALPSKYQLLKNAGVFISTIDLPKGVALNNESPAVKNFSSLFKSWQPKTQNIYLWDYAANFDDYLTPLPILYGKQNQLRYFKEIGTKGIFINASGYEYSPFDDLKTYILAALMMDVNVNVASLAQMYLRKNYPISHQLLSSYYLGLEEEYKNKKLPYNIYGGFKQNVDTYLNIEEFIEFYNALNAIIPQTTGEEREKVQKLYTALSFTRLQIAYLNGSGIYGFAQKKPCKMIYKNETDTIINALEKYKEFDNLTSYKESNGELATYINEWKRIKKTGVYENLLMNADVAIISKPDENYESPELLQDGIQGFKDNYHQGWHLSSIDDFHIRFKVSEDVRKGKNIAFRFLKMEKHRILPPKAIEVIADNKIHTIITTDKLHQDEGTAYCVVPINLQNFNTIEIKFQRDRSSKHIIACDEIQIIK